MLLKRIGQRNAMLWLLLAVVWGWTAFAPGTARGAQEETMPKDAMLGDFFDRGLPGVDIDAVQRKWLDVAYAKESPAQKLDIYLPDNGPGPFPVVVAIHGGSFYRGDKRDFQIVPMLRALGRGYAVVSINYRLSGEARFPSQIYDVKAAIRWVRANAAKYRLNPNAVGLWGDSAGANLATLAGTSAHVAALEDLTMGNPEASSAVDAVVDWYGVIDFLTVATQLNKVSVGKDVSPATRLLGATAKEDPQRYRAASPATYITAEVPPFLIEHGDADTLVSVRQSQDFAAKLRQVAGEGAVRLEILPGAGHLDPAFNTLENTDKVLDFLDVHLK